METSDSCAKLYNELNFERRQAYICYRRFEYPKHLQKIRPIGRLCNCPADNKKEQRDDKQLLELQLHQKGS
jgi:hypothetical protein